MQANLLPFSQMKRKAYSIKTHISRVKLLLCAILKMRLDKALLSLRSLRLYPFYKRVNSINKERPEDYSVYLKKVLSVIQKNEEIYLLAINTSDIVNFSSKLKTVFSKEITSLGDNWGFSQDYEKRTVQVFFLVSACVDTVIQYLKGGLTPSIDIVGDVIIEAIEKLRKPE